MELNTSKPTGRTIYIAAANRFLFIKMKASNTALMKKWRRKLLQDHQPRRNNQRWIRQRGKRSRKDPPLLSRPLQMLSLERPASGTKDASNIFVDFFPPKWGAASSYFAGIRTFIFLSSGFCPQYRCDASCDVHHYY